MHRTAIRDMQPEELAEVEAFSKPALGCACALVALTESKIVGYVEMAPTFFQRDFVSLLSVRPEHRRQGVATALMKTMETRCQGEKLFTSTNLSNSSMQALLGKLGYQLCGIIEELDEGDPELIFVKHLTGSPQPATTE
ncbi:MAG TPA: GNAT family N-acetyltransferase [Terriglobales bacterium]|nr:GNAT family N-acetyltransferase [Terriglobales bacterium]